MGILNGRGREEVKKQKKEISFLIVLICIFFLWIGVTVLIKCFLLEKFFITDFNFRFLKIAQFLLIYFLINYWEFLKAVKDKSNFYQKENVNFLKKNYFLEK